GTQAADVGGEFERQHWDGTVGKVDAGPAQARFLIERAVFGHVLRHIGDVYLQFVIAVFESANEDRVVEIAGCLAVDRNNREVAIVAPPTLLARADHVLDRLSFRERLCREVVRQVVLADHDLDVDPEVFFVAEDFNHSASRILRRRRPVGNFDVDDHAVEVVPVCAPGGLVSKNAVDVFSCSAAVPGASRVGVPPTSARARRPLDCRRDAGGTVERVFVLLFGYFGILHPLRDYYFLTDLFVDGCDIVVARAVVERADHRRVRAIDGADDAAFGAAVRTDRAYFDQDLITVHGIPDEWRGNE